MRSSPARRFRLLATSACLLGLAGTTAGAAAGVLGGDLDAVRAYAQLHGLVPSAPSGTAAGGLVATTTPPADCGPGSAPETAAQGRVPAADYDNGRAAQGYRCNTELVGHYGETGGFQVHRYVDAAGHECAFYDSTLLFPKDARRGVLGTTVLDMSDPTNPVRTAVLQTPAMQSTHESLRLNAARGLLVAGMGSPATQAGFVDVYDVSQDCRTPVLKSTLPIGGLGHEGGFSPDGRTYWVTTTSMRGITAIDLTDPAAPSVVWRNYDYMVHGLSFSADGNRAYLADTGRGGLTILDVSEVQARVAGARAREVSFLTWPVRSIPQNTNAVTIGGKPYLVEYDEFAFDSSGGSGFTQQVGAARIIDISDETQPRVVSDIRLAVHEADARSGDQRNDPGAQVPVQGYAAHYCSVPQEVEPGLLACSMILSGLRLFDIRDPEHPREIGYYNQPKVQTDNPGERGAFAMSAPAFVPERDEVWYSDGNTGFFAVRLADGVWPRDDAGTATAAPAGAPGIAGAPGSAGTAAGTPAATAPGRTRR